MPFFDPINGVVLYTKHEIDCLAFGGAFAGAARKVPVVIPVASWTLDTTSHPLQPARMWYADLQHKLGNPLAVAVSGLDEAGYQLAIQFQKPQDINTLRVWLSFSPEYVVAFMVVG